MATEDVHTLIVGAGQAGIAMSAHLSRHRVPHLVLEKGRIAESWRTARWDSLVANGPAWHDRFPDLAFPCDPQSFVGKEGVADYFEAYARRHEAPVRCGVEVTGAERLPGRPGFRMETSDGIMTARNVVVATGPFRVPSIPALLPPLNGITELHSSAYRNPQQLPEGAVLVVGSGSSGAQIADELLRAGRDVHLSISPHGRPPRRYRGLDCAWWLGVLGKWDVQAETPGKQHVTMAVSGARGGETVDFRRMAARGMRLLGTVRGYADGRILLASDLEENLKRGDQSYLALLDEADAFVTRNGLDLPEEPQAREIGPLLDGLTNTPHDLHLAEAGITTIIWATGFTFDHRWLRVDAFDEAGKPRHQRGVSSERGLYFLGLPWLSGRASSFIWGVWHDARYIADHIAGQDRYLEQITTTP
ncbi:flavin-containing monooxygenase [Rhizobium paknamense]|nr:NAD(P)/FAD-dependent oxidoreductase [Rhizobium paknamense]